MIEARIATVTAGICLLIGTYLFLVTRSFAIAVFFGFFAMLFYALANHWIVEENKLMRSS